MLTAGRCGSAPVGQALEEPAEENGPLFAVAAGGTGMKPQTAAPGVGCGARADCPSGSAFLTTLGTRRPAPSHRSVGAREPGPTDLGASGFDVDRSAITRTIGEVRPLLAERGRTIGPGVRLRTLAEVIDRLGSCGRTGVSACLLPLPADSPSRTRDRMRIGGLGVVAASGSTADPTMGFLRSAHPAARLQRSGGQCRGGQAGAVVAVHLAEP